MSTPSQLTFLQTLAGYAQQVAIDENPSANAPMRIAVIDPAYDPDTYPITQPRVTFEGEETVSDKRYVVVDRSYWPGPGDRVLMIPVGHTYVIAGIIEPVLSPPFMTRADYDHRKYIEGGPSTINCTNGQTETLTTISYGHTFAVWPVVIITPFQAAGGASYYHRVTSRTTTGFTVAWRKPDNSAFTASATMEIFWLAIGT